MKSVFSRGLVAAMAMGAMVVTGISGAASSQTVMSPPQMASAPVPAASKPIPIRSPAVKAAENANEPGKLRPEQRVIPQISLPLKGNNLASPMAPAASLPAGSVPGAVNDGAARCLATSGAKDLAACERGLPASGPLKMRR